MSRSFKKNPFSAITMCESAKKDKVRAHKGLRRTYNFRIRVALKAGQIEDLDLPDYRECTWNNNYSWDRDGNQHYQVPDNRSFTRYLLAQEPSQPSYMKEIYDAWPPSWYVEIMRK